MFSHEGVVVDIIQEYLQAMTWNFHRMDETTLSFEYDGAWKKHDIVVLERTATSELQIQCSLPFVISQEICPEKRQVKKIMQRLRELFDIIHGDFGYGTFHSLKPKGHACMIFWSYRPRLSSEVDAVLLESIFDTALMEIDEYYPSIRLVLSGGVSAQEAYDTAIPTEPYGIA